MLNVDSSAEEVMDAILVGKTADEQVKILRSLYSDAVGHGWVDDEVRNSIFKSACNHHGVPYEEDDEEDPGFDECLMNS